MPYAVSLDDATRTVVLKGFGQGTTADTLQLIADVESTLQQHPGYHVLYDALQLEIESSPQDMMRVASALFGLPGVTWGRFAVAVPTKREQLARVFAALAHDNGVTADVFDNVPEARRWISNAKPPKS